MANIDAMPEDLWEEIGSTLVENVRSYRITFLLAMHLTLLTPACMHGHSEDLSMQGSIHRGGYRPNSGRLPL